MDKVFNVDYTIGYFEVDNDLCLTPQSLSVYLQDIAILHSDSVGYTIDYFNREKKGWVIINWHIEISRMPKKGETIKICTWSSELKRMQAERSFLVYDENEMPIARAISRWIYMDLERRRPVKIDEEMGKSYNTRDFKSIENEDYKMPEIDESQFVSKRDFVVTRRETDSNGHTNNTKYIEWAIDDIPDDIYENGKICDIRVVYRKECYRNSKVSSKCYVKDVDNGRKCVVSVFSNADDETSVLAEVSTIWSL